MVMDNFLLRINGDLITILQIITNNQFVGQLTFKLCTT